MVDAINPLDYFDKSDLSDIYDFNKDGVVNIKDYTDACLYLNDDDTSNDIDYTQAQLDEIFADIIAKNEENYPTEQVTEDNAIEMADEIKKILDAGLSPSQATSLNNLQRIGASLSKLIKQSADIAKVLSPIIENLKKELDELQAEKDEKAAEYAGKSEQVAQKTEQLDAKMQEVLSESNNMVQEQQRKCTSIIKSCVADYKNGLYPGQSLQAVIVTKLAQSGGFNTTTLENKINAATGIGAEIKSLCADIDSLVRDIKDVTERYNSKKQICDINVAARNSAIASGQKASVEYQKGYQKRIDMRNEIIQRYSVQGQTSGDPYTSNNPQVKMLATFLNNKELDNMPYTDAVAIVTEVFDQCGISFNNETGKWSVPKGHDGSSTNIYNAFVNSINANYGIGSDRTDEEYVDPTTVVPTTPETTTPTTTRTDPISFTSGNVKYEFIQDNNGNGVLDDASEFLGAKDGWAEMKAYDANGDGKVSGNELNNLKLVSINQETGQYTFSSAAEAGVTSIDLSSYKESNTMQTNGDILAGNFNLNFKGQTIEGEQTFDTEKNLNSKYTLIFGQEIKEQDDMYSENPFMDEFTETLNTAEKVQSSQNDIANNKTTSDTVISQAKKEQNRKVSSAAMQGEAEKAIIDRRNEKKEAEKAKAEEEKEEAKKLKEEKEAE